MDPELEQAINRYLRMQDASKRPRAYHDLIDTLAPHCKTPEDWQRAARLILERRAEWEEVALVQSEDDHQGDTRHDAHSAR